MKLSLQFDHALTLDELRARIEARVQTFDQRYPRIELRKHYRWVDERTVAGEYRGGHGRLALGERRADLELELPFFARPFRARIEDFLRREARAALGEVATTPSMLPPAMPAPSPPKP